MPECLVQETTQVAILTPIGQGGIAVVRAVGSQVHDWARELFRPRRPLPAELDGTAIHYGHIVNGGETVDEVLVRFVPGEAEGREPAVEVNCHGGIAAVQRVVECFVARGAEEVEGEDLLCRQAATTLQAEAMLALTRAQTELGAKILLDQLDGALPRAAAQWPWDDPPALAETLHRALATERLGLALWQPPSVAVVGPANAGKSTLFNVLARQNRVIVSPVPGTTRDTVSAEVSLAGVPVWLVDTAGQREPQCAIEREAIERARAAAQSADLALLVLDAAEELPVPLDTLREALPERTVTILNKCDLEQRPWARAADGPVRCSARTRAGVPELVERVVFELVGAAQYESCRPVVFTERQAGVLREALRAAEGGRVEAASQRVDACIGGG